MADKDRDDWRKKREREDEREREKEEELALRNPSKGRSAPAGLSSEKIDDLITRADTLIDQLNNLYNMFISGVEKLPPVERRKQLDQTILSIHTVHKPTASLIFRSNGILSKYNAHKERWDKLIRDLENGKIKRKTNLNSKLLRKAA